MTPVNVAFYHQTIGWSLRFICVEERLPKCRCCSNDWVSFNGWGTDWKKKQIYVILKMGHPGLFYLIFFFPGLNFIEKNCRLKQDSTLIVGVESEHADHLTTTTAPKKCCQAACKHVLVKQSRFNKHKLQHKFPLLCFELKVRFMVYSVTIWLHYIFNMCPFTHDNDNLPNSSWSFSK